MADLPPIPPGFVLDTAPPAPPRPPARPADPYKLLKDEGFTFTNGFRTDADTARIRAQGYKPAKNSLHLSGDGVDVDHPSLTPAQQKARLDGLFGGWKGARVIDEKHHRHVQLPGWGEAPGTPGTKNSGLPPIPPGFELQQRGALTGGNFMDAPPPMSERDARVATIRQNGFAPQDEAKLIAGVQSEYSPTQPAQVMAAPTALVRRDQVPEGSMNALSDAQKAKVVQYARTAKSGADLNAYVKSISGGRISLANADDVIKGRNRTGVVREGIVDPALPVAVNTDGAVGSFGRGLADPFNVLDELGGAVDTLGLTGGRESVWNSDRSAKDILYDNIDQNRGVLKADERDHPYARLAGQLTSGVALPYGAGIRGVAGFAKLGAAEGALAGFGGAEGGPLQRLPGAVQGAAIGAAGGAVLGKTLEVAAPVVRKAWDGFKGLARPRRLGSAKAGARVGPFGPVHTDLANNYPAALARLRADETGEVPGAIKHPEIGDIDLVWGNDRYGLAHIAKKHPDVVDDLPNIIEGLPVKQTPEQTGNHRFVLEDDFHRAVIAPDFEGDPKRWLVTAYERKDAPGGQTSRRDPLAPDGKLYGRGATGDILPSALTDNDLPPIPEGFVLDAGPASRTNRAQPAAGRLWTLSRDDLEDLLAEKSMSDQDRLIGAFGEDGAKRFDALDRMRNSRDSKRADEGARLFDDEFGDLTPEQERAAFGVGETDAQVDELRAVLEAHGDVMPGDDADWTAYMAAVAARRVQPEDFAAVTAGEGSATAQASYVRMGKAYANLKASGVATGDIPRRMADALVKRAGWAPGDADELIGSFVRGMERLGAETGSQPSVGRLADGRAAMAADIDVPSLSAPANDVGSLPPIPEGFVLAPPLGRARPMGERVSAADIADMARRVNPEDVTPIPASAVESPDEVPGSFVPMEAPGSLGRAPRRPDGFTNYLRRTFAAESKAKGLPVRIDAEDAIDRGVPAELIYRNPTVADKSKLQLRNPSLFGTRYGRMSAAQQDLRSLDLDTVDPVQWGFDDLAGQRLDPEDVADLIRRDLEGDDTALERGSAYDEWSNYQDRATEKAEFEGRYGDDPPVERRGQPVTMDDLDSIDVPESAYGDGPRVSGKIGNINLDRLENPGDVSRLIGQVRAQVGGFDEASRGVVTNRETQALADELGLTPEQLLKRRRGQALNAEEMYATRVLVQKSREVVAKLARDVQGGTDEQLAQFRNAWMRHVALEEHATAATAEVGRAMQSFKMLARAGDARGEAVKAYLRGGGGRETVEDAAAKLVDMMDNPGAASRFMRDGAKARTRDMLNEFWINSLLSGPKTHIVNAASNTLTALYTLPEHALTTAIGKVLGTPDRALLGEVSQRAVGMIEGAREGLKLAKHAFLTGEPSDAITKVETANYHAIPGRLGEVIRLPTRALTSADEFFKAVNRRGALNAMAYRRAQADGRTAAERLQRFQDLVAEPDKMLRDYADNQARYLTFQSPLGEAGRGLTQFVNRVPGLKLIVPFIRTPINLLKFAGERSVFAPGLKEFRDAWKAGGNARNEAVARMTMGSGLSALAVSYALDGRLSGGGPSNARERAALVNSGWQPYSVKIGDRWVSYQRFDPISMLIGAAADFAEVGTNATAKEGEDIALGLGIAVAKNVTSKTWLSGLSDFFEVLTDPERYGESWAKRMAGSLAVPALGAHVASATDPNMREVNSVLDAIKNRLPGLSHNLIERRNVWGDEIKRGNGAGGSALSSAYSFVSPVSSSVIKPSPLLREVARLRAPLSMPQRRVRVGGVDRPLTPGQHAMYVQLAGKPAKAHLEEYVGTSEWKALTDDERRDYLADTLKETRADAREQLLSIFPALAAEPDLPPIPPGYQLPPIPPGFQLAR